MVGWARGWAESCGTWLKRLINPVPKRHVSYLGAWGAGVLGGSRYFILAPQIAVGAGLRLFLRLLCLGGALELDVEQLVVADLVWGDNVRALIARFIVVLRDRSGFDDLSNVLPLLARQLICSKVDAI